MRPSLPLIALLAALTPATAAQVVATGPFTGDLTEGFDHLDFFTQQCNSLPVFAGLGQVCAPLPDALFAVTNSTGPLSNPCTISDISGPGFGLHLGNIDLDGDKDSGTVTWTFSQPIPRFGGFFNANDSLLQPDQGDEEVRIYDEFGNLLFQDTFLLTNDCTWNWNGWEALSGPGIARIELVSGTSSRDLTMDECTLDLYVDPVVDLGSALAGTAGAPSFDLVGFPGLLQSVSFELSGAAPSSLALLGVSTGQSALPFLGGTLVPDPLATNVVLSKSTDAGGEATIQAPWPATALAGVTIYCQWWIVDAGGPFGMAASNALAVTGA